MIFNGCEDYWKQVVKDIIDCGYFDDDYEFSEDQIKQVVKYLLNDEQMWQEIDCSVVYYLREIKGENND